MLMFGGNTVGSWALLVTVIIGVEVVGREHVGHSPEGLVM